MKSFFYAKKINTGVKMKEKEKIMRKKFKKSLRGYDMTEVDIYVRQLIMKIEKLKKEK